ncbi:MAG TPA: GNAT family N-acetyltransferase [Ignavibacteriaceae bacterium]
MKRVSDKLTIRETSEADIPEIFRLIRELAEYEKLDHTLSSDEQMLRKNLFGKDRYARVVLAEYEAKITGMALFFYNFSTFKGKPGIFLEDLFVRPEYRRKGIGKALLMYLIQLAKNDNFGRVEWAVLNWNQSAIDFYQSLGAKPMNDWIIFRLEDDSF